MTEEFLLESPAACPQLKESPWLCCLVVRGQALWSPGGSGARACVCDDSAVPVVVGLWPPLKDPPRKLAWLLSGAAAHPGHLRHPKAWRWRWGGPSGARAQALPLPLRPPCQAFSSWARGAWVPPSSALSPGSVSFGRLTSLSRSLRPHSPSHAPRPPA